MPLYKLTRYTPYIIEGIITGNPVIIAGVAVAGLVYLGKKIAESCSRRLPYDHGQRQNRI